MRYLLACLGSGVVMGLLDALWLTLMGPRLYRPALGDLLAPKPDMTAAAAFYGIYLGGIVFLAVLPALREASAMRAGLSGAVLGLAAYAAYDLTNQATLRSWPVHLTLIDLCWGVFMTAMAALGGYWLATRAG